VVVLSVTAEIWVRVHRLRDSEKACIQQMVPLELLWFWSGTVCIRSKLLVSLVSIASFKTKFNRLAFGF
jgi:hypothetical protein